MDALQLTDEQSHTLYEALKCYAAHLNQPNEQAVDHAETRSKVHQLLQYIESNTTLAHKTYKMVNGQWVLQS